MLGVASLIKDSDQLNQLLEKVKPYQALLLQHPLYDRLDSITAIDEKITEGRSHRKCDRFQCVYLLSIHIKYLFSRKNTPHHKQSYS